MKRWQIILSVIILGTIGFLKYGRGVYIPIINKFKGMETVDSIIEKIEEDVLKRLESNLERIGFEELPDELVIVGLKEERILEVYAMAENQFKLLKTYPFTAFSGKLGPKLKEGDNQIPEGIYKIEYLNPNSSYYLSMKINYPNELDLSKTEFETIDELGSNIFIHGKSVTIGCIPIGDKGIEELFILVKNSIDKDVKVILSPRDFRRNSETPNIEGIDWELELYEAIENELGALPNNS